MMVKRLARNNLLIKLIQNEDGFFETKKNNKNKKSFIGFKSVAYLSSIKTRFNRSVARTVLFFASYFYTFTGLRMQCIRLFSVFFGTARCATDSLQLYAIRKMYIAEHQISLKLSEWKRHLIEWIRQNNKKYKQKPKKKSKAKKKCKKCSFPVVSYAYKVTIAVSLCI